jgi:hypothetical protein
MSGLRRKPSSFRDSLFVRLYPELDRLEDAAARKKILGSSEFGTAFNWQFMAVTFVLSILAGIPCIYFIISTTSKTSWIYICCTVVLGGLGISLVSVAPHLLFRQRMRRILREVLQKRGIPICVHCGYDLTGCPNDRCPER